MPGTGAPREPRRLRLPAEVGRLADVRAFVRQAVEDFGGSARAADDLVQAVDEATSNVMVHGYRGSPGEIEIEAAVRDHRIEVSVLDRCPTFDPTTRTSPDLSLPLEPHRAGGMGVGVHLLRTMTDEVRHDVRPGGGNVLTLVRAIDEPDGQEG